MDRNNGSEDNTENVRHVQDAQQNRDALEAQARRTDATAPEATSHPVQGLSNRGSGGSGTTGSEDNTQAMRNVQNAEANTEALQAESRRVEATTPPDINRTGPQNNDR
ncbi:MAG: hypothetical protein JO040_09320 [Gemmatimonadetes bacterium]|nr:hypothetical protein [Gemmatimonadota bacterium]